MYKQSNVDNFAQSMCFVFSLHTLAFEGLTISDKSSYIAVVAIDFGTTYSGFAFAFNHKEGEGGIHMNKAWGNEQGFSTLKTPTSLLLRPDGQFDSFGFEADEKYANFFGGEDQEYMYFKRFKMALHKSEVRVFVRRCSSLVHWNAGSR